MQVTNTFTLSGGTLGGATVVTGTTIQGTSSGGTLSGVILNGNLDVTGSNANLAVANGLTLNGTLTIGNDDRVYFTGTQTLGGTGNVNFANNANYSGMIVNQNATTLTIGPGITIHGGSNSGVGSFYTGAVIGASDLWGGGSNANIVNHGKFSGDVAGQTLEVRSSGTFTNAGTLGAANGGTLNVQPASLTNFASNTLTGGTWQAVGGGTLRVGLASALTTNAATIVLDGPNSHFFGNSGTTSAMAGLTSNAAGGSLTIQNGANFTLPAGFTNAGALTVGSASTVGLGGSYTQTGGSTQLQAGTIVSPHPPLGSALSFNGSNYVSVPNASSLNPTSQVTVEAWIKPTQLSNSEIGIAGTWDDVTGNNRTYFLWILNGKVQFYVSHTGSDYQSATSATTLQPGTWYHVAGTFDGTNLKLYIDGNLEATTNSPGAIFTNSKPFYIGRTDAGGRSNYFNGVIDEVRVWNTARTAADIQANLGQGLAGNETGLAAYWPMDEGSGGTIFDKTANGSNGSLGGGAVANAPAWYAVSQANLTNPSGMLGTVSPPVSGGLSFDGATNYVHVGNLGARPTQGTISFWMDPATITNLGNPFTTGPLPNSYPNGNQGIRFEENPSGNFSVLLGNDTAGYPNGFTGHTLTNSLQANQWDQVTLTWDSSTNLVWGYFNGQLADVQIWSVAQTQSQVQAGMFGQPTGTESGLIGYWPLNEGSGTIAHDLGPQKHDGTLSSPAPPGSALLHRRCRLRGERSPAPARSSPTSRTRPLSARAVSAPAPSPWREATPKPRPAPSMSIWAA